MAEIKSINKIIEDISPYYKKRVGMKKAGLINYVAESENTLTYDSSSETLEPIYFFILDLLSGMGLTPEKLVDSFTSSPGSGHFTELGQRKTIMQQQGTKIMGDINVVLRSVLNIIYDLKEFRIRLQHYDDLKTDKKDAAILALKQIWMDKVDFTKGNSSIKAMAFAQGGAGRTLIDAFLIAKTIEDVNKLDLNDIVKRILIPRIQEFNIWLDQSGSELRKRYEIEKTYLRSQVNSLKLYSRWAKPYLKAAQELEGGEKSARNPSLVKAFNTILLELTLFSKSELDPKTAALEGDLPSDFTKEKNLRTLKRKYYSCILIDFFFRGIPQRVAQQAHYAFGGRAEVTFRSYSLNEDELKKLEEELKKSDVEDVLKLIEGTTEESLKQLQEDINSFLEEDKKEEITEKKSKDESNPFLALIGYYNKKEKKNLEKKPEKPKPESFIEKEYLRKIAGKNAADITFNLFDVYKKAHGMASYT